MRRAYGHDCGKAAYRSFRHAEREAVIAERREGVEIRVYHHADCGMWHITSRPAQDNDARWRRTQT